MSILADDLLTTDGWTGNVLGRSAEEMRPRWVVNRCLFCICVLISIALLIVAAA